MPFLVKLPRNPSHPDSLVEQERYLNIINGRSTLVQRELRRRGYAGYELATSSCMCAVFELLADSGEQGPSGLGRRQLGDKRVEPLQQGHALIQIDGGEPVGPYRACPATTRETSGSSKRFFVMSVTCVAQHIPQVVDQQQLDTHA